jgi:transposase
VRIADLPDDVEALKRMIAELRFENTQLRAAIFARKSEKFDPHDVLQSRLFNEIEAELAKGPELFGDAAAVQVPAHHRKKSGRQPLPPDLPREEILIDVPEREKRCACGAERVRIGEERSEELDIIPLQIQVRVLVRPKYACHACEGAGDESRPAVLIAPVPPRILPKSLLTPGAIAACFIAKFCDAVPFYRQEGILMRHGVSITRETLANYAMRLMADRRFLRYLALLRRLLLDGPLLGIDETPLKVLHAERQQAYMWAMRGGPPGKPAVWFRYRPTRSASFLRSFLRRFHGAIQSDGWESYAKALRGIKRKIVHAGCWAHVRRKFFKLYRAAPKSSSARYALAVIRRLYRIERLAREKNLDPAGVRALREKLAQPRLERFKKWLDRVALCTPPEGMLGQAVAYALGEWPKLVVYLADGHIPIDNNLVENMIRPFVVGRKNWLFSVAPLGAHASAALYTVIENAKANGLEPYHYMRHLFEHLPLARSRADLMALLPQFIDPDLLPPTLQRPSRVAAADPVRVS